MPDTPSSEPRDEVSNAPTADAWVPDPRRWRILIVTLCVAFMALLDTTIVNIALPTMQAGLNASAGAIQWVVSGYALTFGLVLVTGGRLGDAHGRRPLMLVGLTIFVLSSIACGLAPNIGWLIVGRLVQGAAGGLFVPQNSGILQTYFRGSERAKAFGFMGFTVGVSSAVGPVLGGLIIAALGDGIGWRAIFLVNVPICLVLLFAVAKVTPAERVEGATTDLDIVGALMLGATVVFVIYPVATLETGVSAQLALILLAPVFAVLTVLVERRVGARGGTPLLDIGLLQNTPGYFGGVLVGTLYFTGFSGVLLVYSLYLQTGLHMSTLMAGGIVAAFALANAVSAPVGGRIVPRLGRRTTVLALSIMMTGLASTAILVPALSGVARILALVVTLLVTGFGAGMVVSPNLALSLTHVPTRMAGAAGAAMQTGQRMGGALGSALMMSIYELTASRTGDPGTALRVVAAACLAIILCALAAAVHDLRSNRNVAAL